MHESSVTLHELWCITPLYFFRWNVTYFPQKNPIKVHIFETFECSDQKSLNSCHFWPNSYQFWNKKLVFIHILHHSSVSLNITPFFNWFLESSNRSSLSKYKFGRISCEQFKVCTLISSFCPNHIKFLLEKNRKVISHHENFKEKLTLIWNMTIGIW